MTLPPGELPCPGPDPYWDPEWMSMSIDVFLVFVNK